MAPVNQNLLGGRSVSAVQPTFASGSNLLGGATPQPAAAATTTNRVAQPVSGNVYGTTKSMAGGAPQRPAGCRSTIVQIGAAGGGPMRPKCEPGLTYNDLWQACCPPGTGSGASGSGGGGGTFSMPSLPAGVGAGAGNWSPSNLQRPNLTPIDPQAAYDPEMYAQLGQQRGFSEMIKAGTGFAEDVSSQAQRDSAQARLREAEQAAAQAGIPFDKAAFLANESRSDAARRAAQTTAREDIYGRSVGESTRAAGAMAGERTDRLDIDLKRDTTENELALDRYGRDIQKYGIDAQAATAANGALMDFYSKLMGGMFSMASSYGGGGGSYSSSYNFG